MKIEKIVESDFSELNTLFREFAEFENHADSMTNTVEQMQEEKTLFNGFVVRNDEKRIVGYVIYFYAYFTWTGKTMYMDDLYISQPYRGKGIGSMLINAVIEHAKELGLKKIRWQVSNWNQPAMKFYEKLGASISGVEMNCDLLLK